MLELPEDGMPCCPPAAAVVTLLEAEATSILGLPGALCDEVVASLLLFERAEDERLLALLLECEEVLC